MEKITNHLCNNQELKNQAYKVRHDAYVSVEFIQPQSSGLFVDEFDPLDNNFTFLLKRDSVPVATVRASVYQKERQWVGMPCLSEGFGKEINELCNEFDCIIEMNRLAVLPGIKDLQAMAPLALFTNVEIFRSHFKNAALVCASGKSHVRFYQRLGFKQHCEMLPRPNAEIDLTLMVKPLDHNGTQINQYISEKDVQQLSAKPTQQELIDAQIKAA